MCVGADTTVADAMRRIDDNLLGVVFVVEPDLTLLGSLTDGDVRRALLAGRLDLTAPVAGIMNDKPRALEEGSGAEATFAALSTGLRDGKAVFPRIDAEGRIRSFSYREDWGLVPIAEPQLAGNEARYVLECVESSWISSTGPFVEEFEGSFAEFTGLQHPVAVSNGTVALTLALQALGLTPGAEVIVPDLTFAATANAVVAAGGVPVLVDVDPDSWGLTPGLVEPAIGPRTWGVMPVHLYGNACDAPGLRELCDSRGLMMVEDCAEAIGTRIDDRHVGAFGHAASFSFFGNKTLTTGEGGMTFFEDPAAGQRARVLRDHGMSKTRKYWHDVIGFNYRLTNLQAAIGVAQLERADELVGAKFRNAAAYLHGLADVRGARPMVQSTHGACSYWLFPVLLEGATTADREVVMEALAVRGIQTRTVFPALHEMPAFARMRRSEDMTVSLDIAGRGLCLPNNPRMTAEDIEHVLASLAESLATAGLGGSL